MTRYKLLFVSAGVGAVALLGSSLVASSDRHQSDESETATTDQFERTDVGSSRDRSPSATRRESVKRHVDPIFRAP